MTTTPRRGLSFRGMNMLAVVAGVLAIVLQFMPDMTLVSLLIASAGLGGLLGFDMRLDSQDYQPVEKSYKPVVETLLLLLLAAYAFIELSRWLPIEGLVIFLNGHWPGLLLAIMCLAFGVAGLRGRVRSPRSA